MSAAERLHAPVRLRACRLCGAKETRDTNPKGHAFGEWYVVKAAQIGVAGLEERQCSACGLTEQREIPPLDGDGQPPVDNGQEQQPLELLPPTISIVCTTTPANGQYYVTDETVYFTVTCTNPNMIPVQIETAGAFVSATDFSALFAGVIGPDHSLSANIGYIVTSTDGYAGAAEYIAWADWSLPGTSAVRIETPVGSFPCGIEGADAAVSKRAVSTPANGEFYVKNETIQYEVVFQNLRGHELMNVKLTDPLIGSWVIGNAGQVYGRQTHVFSFCYKVQDKDVEAGFVSNTATVQWDKYKAGTKPQASTNTVTVACGRMNPVTISKTATSVTWQMDCGFPDTDGDGLPDIPFGVIHGLSVTKKEESLPLNGQYYVEGEVIHYTMTYTNVGELPLIDVEIFDLMGGMAAIGSAEKLDSIVVPAEVNGVAVRGIEYMAFNMHKNFKHLTIADGAAMLDRRVLRDLLKLEAVELPGSLLVIREGNFTNLPMLTSVVIPANVVLVHSSFNKCASLASITFEGMCPLFVTEGSFGMFTELPADCVIYVPDNQLGAYKAAFADREDVVARIQPSGKRAEAIERPASESDIAFDASTGTITSYTGSADCLVIPDAIGGVQVKHIADFAFETNVCCIVIPEGVETVGQYSLGRELLSYVSLPSTLTNVGAGAFSSSRVSAPTK